MLKSMEMLKSIETLPPCSKLPRAMNIKKCIKDQWNVNNLTRCEHREPGHLSVYPNRHNDRALTSREVRTKLAE